MTITILQKMLFGLTAGLLITGGAQAAVNYGHTNTAQPYIGAKIGQLDLDKADDDAMSYGVYTGVKFPGNVGLEAEYMRTKDDDFAKKHGERKEYQAEMYGLYATYDYLFPSSNLYAKGRVGLSRNEIEIEDKVRGGKNSQHDIGVGGGLGFGYNISPNAAVELAYDWYPKVDNVDGRHDLRSEGITLGANFKF